MTEPILYFVRHGETDWNAEARLQGQRDIPLNGRGRDQARQAGVLLRGLLARDRREAASFNFISSTLVRARETMELLRAELALAPRGYGTDARLAEMSFGQWEGLTFKEVKAKDPATLKARDRDRWNFCPPGGESYEHLLRRVSASHAEMAGDMVVVAHGGVARAFFAHLGIMPKDDATSGRIDQGVVYALARGRMERIA